MVAPDAQLKRSAFHTVLEVLAHTCQLTQPLALLSALVLELVLKLVLELVSILLSASQQFFARLVKQGQVLRHI